MKELEGEVKAVKRHISDLSRAAEGQKAKIISHEKVRQHDRLHSPFGNRCISTEITTPCGWVAAAFSTIN